MRLIYTEEDFKDFKNTGYYFQITHGRTLSNISHSHDFYEIIYVISGKCAQAVNEVFEDYCEGDMICLCPGDIHYFSSQQPNTSIFSLSVSTDVFELFISPYGKPEFFKKYSNTKKFHLNLSAQQFLLANYINLSSDTTQSDNCKLLLGTIAYILFEHISTLDAQKSSLPIFFSDLMIKMNEPANIKGGMNALISISNFSHSHLCRLFKKYHNTTPNEYISKLRMNYAYELVSNSNMPIDMIAEEVGYQSLSHFIQKFKETYNSTPVSVRKQRNAKTV